MTANDGSTGVTWSVATLQTAITDFEMVKLSP